MSRLKSLEFHNCCEDLFLVQLQSGEKKKKKKLSIKDGLNSFRKTQSPNYFLAIYVPRISAI